MKAYPQTDHQTPAHFIRLCKGLKILLLAAAVCLLLQSEAMAQVTVQDIFGRTLNQRGITLVDWDGYMANPLIKFYVFAPTNAALPGSATLTVNGTRLYFDTPSTVGSTGPSKTVSISSAGLGAPAQLSIFPAHNDVDGNYTLTIVFTDAHGVKTQNTVPILVNALDLHRTNDFNVTENFDRDITGVFADTTRRALTQQAADDWAYYFAVMNLDQVPAGTEQTYIWSNDFDGGYYFTSTNTYTGYLLYAYGTSNSTHRSGGEASFNGGSQTSGGITLPLHRSGGFESEIYGNYNTLGWLFLTNDSDWLVTGNLGDETNDYYSIAHHEIGHALIFNEGHPGFAVAMTNGAFTSAAVTNYYGGPVAIDSSDHLTGAIDPESGQGAFGYEYYGNIPRKRWTMTKLDLLCAQEVGYVLRSNAAFTALTFPGNAPTPAAQTIPYAFSFSVSGGIPIYAWDITAGALPPGLALDSFSGALAGTPTARGTFNFTVRVRDYHAGSVGLSQNVTLNVAPPPPVQLSVSVAGQGTNGTLQLILHGTAGQREVLQVSSNLVDWMPLVTNASASNLFQFNETNTSQFPSRFYRAIVLP